MRILWLTLRGAAGFGLAAALTFGGFELLLVAPLISDRLLWPIMFVAPFLAGAAAAWILIPNHVGTASSGAFGCGFVVIWAVISFAHISLQGGGRPEFGWAAMAGGVSFAIAGASGGAAIDPRLLVPAALFFGIAGALSTALSFYLAWTGSPLWGIPAAMTSGGAAAGALLGAYMGFSGLDEPRSRFRVPR